MLVHRCLAQVHSRACMHGCCLFVVLCSGANANVPPVFSRLPSRSFHIPCYGAHENISSWDWWFHVFTTAYIKTMNEFYMEEDVSTDRHEQRPRMHTPEMHDEPNLLSSLGVFSWKTLLSRPNVASSCLYSDTHLLFPCCRP